MGIVSCNQMLTGYIIGYKVAFNKLVRGGIGTGDVSLVQSPSSLITTVFGLLLLETVFY